MRSRSRASATGTFTGTMIALSPSTGEAYTVPNSMNAVELELRNVSRKYGDVVAVRDLSFKVPAGKICILVGPSGCGKTTTLNLVAGFQALGTLMAVGIMLLPAVTARFWAEDVSGLVVVAIASAFAATVAGLLLSYYANVPTGPAIVLLCGAFYLVSMLLGPRGGLIWGLVPRRHLEA